MKTIQLLVLVALVYSSTATLYWQYLIESAATNEGLDGTFSPEAHYSGSFLPSFSYDEKNGLFYIYGGFKSSMNITGSWNTLWVYSLAKNQFRLLSGNSSETNIWPTYGELGVSSLINPGSRTRGISFFSQARSAFFVGFGEYDSSNPYLAADLWAFDTQLQVWTWVNGKEGYYIFGSYNDLENQYPGGRSDSMVVYSEDTEILLLVGGFGLGAEEQSEGMYGILGDFWIYHVKYNKWEYSHGPKTINSLTIYGDKGYPGGFLGGVQNGQMYQDDDMKIYIYGGIQMTDDEKVPDFTSDIWMYNYEKSWYVWLAGDRGFTMGYYGFIGIPSPKNIPPSRDYSMGFFTLNTMKVYIYGGFQYPRKVLNDFWEFDIKTRNFTWLSGLQTPNSVGRGVLNSEFDEDTIPNSRMGSAHFFDSSLGKFCFFGGYGSKMDSKERYVQVGDVWCAIDDNWVQGVEDEKPTPVATRVTIRVNSTIDYTTTSNSGPLYVTKIITASPDTMRGNTNNSSSTGNILAGIAVGSILTLLIVALVRWVQKGQGNQVYSNLEEMKPISTKQKATGAPTSTASRYEEDD